MIISDCVRINRVENISTEYIEKELKKCEIEPIRWAITHVSDKDLIITLAYERK
ncbi:hypothetical protein IJ818_06205 [bacterium]|nr:hypothetical protein [bacterium]